MTADPAAVALRSRAVVYKVRLTGHWGVEGVFRIPTRQIDHALQNRRESRCVWDFDRAEPALLCLPLGRDIADMAIARLCKARSGLGKRAKVAMDVGAGGQNILSKKVISLCAFGGLGLGRIWASWSSCWGVEDWKRWRRCS
jgi:hypothetical protein